VTYSDNNNRRYYQTGLYLQDEMVWAAGIWMFPAATIALFRNRSAIPSAPPAAAQMTISAAGHRCCMRWKTASRRT
jgi:hypothetical protein